jgi:hypothetical protein
LGKEAMKLSVFSQTPSRTLTLVSTDIRLRVQNSTIF